MHYLGMAAMILPEGSTCMQMPGVVAGPALAYRGVGTALLFMLGLLAVLLRGRMRGREATWAHCCADVSFLVQVVLAAVHHRPPDNRSVTGVTGKFVTATRPLTYRRGWIAAVDRAVPSALRVRWSPHGQGCFGALRLA